MGYCFRTRNLRRQYFVPMTGFLYVEPFELRKEIIIRPRDLQHWIDLGLEKRETISVEMQPELKRTAAEFLSEPPRTSRLEPHTSFVFPTPVGLSSLAERASHRRTAQLRLPDRCPDARLPTPAGAS